MCDLGGITGNVEMYTIYQQQINSDIGLNAEARENTSLPVA